jgi:hypothetical protein
LRAHALALDKQRVNREEQGKLIARMSGDVIMIDQSNYSVSSQFGNDACRIFATQSGWRDHVCRGVKCKDIYAVEFSAPK